MPDMPIARVMWEPQDMADEVFLAIQFAPKPIVYDDIWTGNPDTDRYWSV
jgi:hypothetical protein